MSSAAEASEHRFHDVAFWHAGFFFLAPSLAEAPGGLCDDLYAIDSMAGKGEAIPPDLLDRMRANFNDFILAVIRAPLEAPMRGVDRSQINLLYAIARVGVTANEARRATQDVQAGRAIDVRIYVLFLLQELLFSGEDERPWEILANGIRAMPEVASSPHLMRLADRITTLYDEASD